MTHLDNSQLINYIHTRISPHGYDCLDVDWERQDSILRIYIDREGGVKVPDCILVTHLFDEDHKLDALVPTIPYTLEVSSPGIDRPLRTSAHFKMAIGENLQIRYIEPIAEQIRDLTGVLLRIEDDGLMTLLLESREVTFSIDAVIKANLIAKWN